MKRKFFSLVSFAACVFLSQEMSISGTRNNKAIYFRIQFSITLKIEGERVISKEDIHII